MFCRFHSRFPSKSTFQIVFWKTNFLFFYPNVLRKIIYVFQSQFKHNVVSSSDTQFNWQECLKPAIWSFVPSNRKKIIWKDQRLHSCLTRVDIQVQFSWYLLAAFPPSVSEVIFYANRRSVRRFWVSFPATRSLEDATAETFVYVSYLLVVELFQDTTSFISPTRLLKDLARLEFPTEMIFGSVRCIGNLTDWGFLRVYVVMSYLEILCFPPKVACL